MAPTPPNPYHRVALRRSENGDPERVGRELWRALRKLLENGSIRGPIQGVVPRRGQVMVGTEAESSGLLRYAKLDSPSSTSPGASHELTFVMLGDPTRSLEVGVSLADPTISTDEWVYVEARMAHVGDERMCADLLSLFMALGEELAADAGFVETCFQRPPIDDLYPVGWATLIKSPPPGFYVAEPAHFILMGERGYVVADPTRLDDDPTVSATRAGLTARLAPLFSREELARREGSVRPPQATGPSTEELIELIDDDEEEVPVTVKIEEPQLPTASMARPHPVNAPDAPYDDPPTSLEVTVDELPPGVLPPGVPPPGVPPIRR